MCKQEAQRTDQQRAEKGGYLCRRIYVVDKQWTATNCKHFFCKTRTDQKYLTSTLWRWECG